MSIRTTNRVTGLFSGMDTESIVKGMLSRTQSKVDKGYQQKVKLEWQLDSYREVNKRISTFRSTYMSVLDQKNNMLNAANYQGYKVNYLTGNEKNAVSIKASGAPAQSKITIDEISQLAKSSAAVSAGKISNGPTGVGLSESNFTQLKDLDFANDLQFDNGRISFSINGANFTFAETDTLQQMVNTVNSSDAANVTMTYSRLTDKFSITSKDSGAESQVNIQNISGNAFGANSAFGIDNGIVQNGTNAMLKIDGTDVEMESNTFSIDGVEYTLNSTTSDAITFTMSQDLDEIVDKVKKMVDAYNEMIGYIDTMTSEAPVRGFNPLTEAQKSEMTEAEITTWETQAKRGLMRNDSNMSTLLGELRSELYTEVQGLGMSPADIGFETGSWDRKGQIQFNEDKFRAAMAEDPETTIAVMTNNRTATGVEDDRNGLFTEISNQLLNYTKQVQQGSMYERDVQLNRKTAEWESLQDKLAQEEERAWAKMAAMETQLANMQQQSDWFSQQLGLSTQK